LTKKLRSAVSEFHKRFLQNAQSLIEIDRKTVTPQLKAGNAQELPLIAESIDLIVTSPPYASNAIDYMRAHKFSLVWLGYSIDQLMNARKNCIGGESTSEFDYETLPPYTQKIVNTLTTLDSKKGRVLHRYYSEMTRVLQEMYRVLKPKKAAVIVVATSIMRDVDTETQTCLVEIGKKLGFEASPIGVRQLDRNRRMLPAGMEINRGSQIQQRMHEEYVLGFYKP
jgi:DNA modification methylase